MMGLARGIFRPQKTMGKFWRMLYPPQNFGVILVDGRNPANQWICSLSHYLQGFFTSQVVVWDFFHQLTVL